jgi:hypothetical protein
MAVLRGMMSAIIRGKQNLSNVFAILLRSLGRLRASHIDMSHCLAGACTTRVSTRVAVRDASPARNWRWAMVAD